MSRIVILPGGFVIINLYPCNTNVCVSMWNITQCISMQTHAHQCGKATKPHRSFRGDFCLFTAQNIVDNSVIYIVNNSTSQSTSTDPPAFLDARTLTEPTFQVITQTVRLESDHRDATFFERHQGQRFSCSGLNRCWSPSAGRRGIQPEAQHSPDTVLLYNELVWKNLCYLCIYCSV